MIGYDHHEEEGGRANLRHDNDTDLLNAKQHRAAEEKHAI